MRKTIGRNPLAPEPSVVVSGPGPLDVLIPKGASAPAEAHPTQPELSATSPVAEEAAPPPVPVESRPPEGEPSPEAPPAPRRPPFVPESSAAEPPYDSPALEGPAAGQHLVFLTGGEELAVPIHRVREIVEYGLVTRVPRMPPCIRGVTNLRGSIVPVVDLALRLGLPPREHSSRTSVVVVEANLGGQTTIVGLVADAVTAVRDLLPEDLSATPAFGGRVSANAFSGLGRAEDRLFLVLDTERALANLDLGVRDAGRA